MYYRFSGGDCQGVWEKMLDIPQYGLLLSWWFGAIFDALSISMRP